MMVLQMFLSSISMILSLVGVCSSRQLCLTLAPEQKKGKVKVVVVVEEGRQTECLFSGVSGKEEWTQWKRERRKK